MNGMVLRWGLKWKTTILWHDTKPLLFNTRQEARHWAKEQYGYILIRRDLRQPPRLPQAVRVKVVIREC